MNVVHASERSIHQSQPVVLKHLWLEITEKCNLSCVHCYSESNPHLPISYGMDVDHWVNTLRTARAMGCGSVQFIGGEPTIHPHLDFLLHEASLLGYESIEVFTNGVSISSERITRYKEWNIRVALSFYSVNADIHDSITERKGSYQKTLSFIKRGLQAGLDLRVGLIQIDQSDDEIKEAEQLLRSLGVRNISSDRVRKIGRARRENVQSDFSLKHDCLHELCGACHDGRACVTSSGSVFPCIMARQELVGNILSEDLQDIMNGQPRQQFVERQIAYIESNGTKQHILSNDPCSPVTNGGTCVPQMGNCNPNQSNYTDIRQKGQHVFSKDPCSPVANGGTCVPQMGNCNPNQSNYIDIKQFVADNSCNPENGGTCVPQMGNCPPNDKRQ